MNGNEIALDTNQAIAVLNDVGASSTWISGYSRVWVPIPVVGELHFGMINSRDAAKNLRRLDEFLRRVQVLPITLETTPLYAEVRLQLKRAGTPIPGNDVWIASVCRQHGLALATSDNHFDCVEGLRVEKRPPPR